MIRIDILTLLPELLESPLNHSIVQRAKDKGLATIFIHNIRDYGKGKYRQTDDYPFGGEAGMVIMIEPVYKIITQLKKEREYDEVIYMSPDGQILDQGISNSLSLKSNLIILCGHYKGVDQRVRDTFITREISIGDYVLTNGALSAAVVVDAVVRLLPGALGDAQSAVQDSFTENLLDHPHYTRPETFQEWTVPPVLLSGNHAAIEEWRRSQAEKLTKTRRPDLK